MGDEVNNTLPSGKAYRLRDVGPLVFSQMIESCDSRGNATPATVVAIVAEPALSLDANSKDYFDSKVTRADWVFLWRQANKALADALKEQAAPLELSASD